MSERKRKSRERTKRPARPQDKQVLTPATGVTPEENEAEKRLHSLDAAVNDLINRRIDLTGQSVVAGEQQPHRTQNPLSDETIVKRFIQTPGE